MSDQANQANALIHRAALWSLGAGFVPFPVVDLAAVTAIQIKLIRDLTEVYGVEFSEQRGKAIAGGVIGAVGSNHLALGAVGSSLKIVPIFGGLFGLVSLPVFYAAGTFAIGRVFAGHLAAGGNMLDFNLSNVKEEIEEAFAEGKAKYSRKKSSSAKSTKATAPA